MAKIGFIGLGNMGRHMARNLSKAGHQVTGYDISPAARQAYAEGQGKVADSIKAAVAGADFVVSMVNTGTHSRAVYEGPDGAMAHAPKSAILIDCSTIDVETARHLAKEAAAKGFTMLDAPVSGGTTGAEAATLTFMVGGKKEAFAKVKPILDGMGKFIAHVGDSGAGQAVKICNNMIAGSAMIATAEALILGQKLGVDLQTLYDVISQSSGSTFVLTRYCPLPGPVPTTPANRDYAPGFTTAMMLKDLRLAQDAARGAGASTPMGATAAAILQMVVNAGYAEKDYTVTAKLLAGELQGVKK